MLTKLNSLRSAGVSEEGFTLIELIIVVVIIGILAAVAIPMFMNQQKAAIAAGVKSDVRNTNTNIATALAKAPTAGTVGGAAVTTPIAGGATFTANGADITVGTATADTVISDSATTLRIGGAWNTYKIVGTNTAIGAATATANYFQFDVATGVYAGTGDLA